MQVNESGHKSFRSAIANMELHRRVKLDATGKLIYAGAGEKDIGTTTTRGYEINDQVTVRLRNVAGTIACVASGPVAIGADVAGDADGKVVAGAGFGQALSVAVLAGDYIEVLRD